MAGKHALGMCVTSRTLRTDSQGHLGEGYVLCCFVLLCCIQQRFFENVARKVVICTRQGASRSSGTAPVALGSGQPATWTAMDLGGEGQHGQGQPPKHRGTGAIGWPKSACRDAPRPDQQPHATAPASGWPGPTPVRRARRIELARRRGTALQDHVAGNAMQHHRSSVQLSPTASYLDRAARHSLARRTNRAPRGEAPAVGRCGPQV